VTRKITEAPPMPFVPRQQTQIPTSPGRRETDVTPGADFVTLAQKGGGWFSFLTPSGYFIVSQKGSGADARYDINYYDVTEKTVSRGISGEELLKYQDSIGRNMTVVTTALGPPKQPDPKAVQRVMPRKGHWQKMLGLLKGLVSSGKKEHAEHLAECLLFNSVGVKTEVHKMESRDLVKKDLLRRKIQEHFGKHPESKSVIVKADVGDVKTIWRVQREGRSFSVVEVNTNREQFVISEAVGTPEQLFGQFSTAVMQGGFNPNPQQTQMISNAFNSLPQGPFRKAAEEMIKGAGLQSKVRTTAQSGQQMGGLGRASTTSTLSMGAAPKGTGLAETDEEKPKSKKLDLDKPKKLKEPEKPSSDKPLGAEPAATPDAMEPSKDVPSAETDVDVAPDAEPSPEGDMAEPVPTKTGEEKQLQSLIQNKPVQNIEVSSESNKGTIVLTLGGLKNPLEIDFFNNGKVTYKLGTLSRLLKPGASD
jgi:hypothetical protein